MKFLFSFASLLGLALASSRLMAGQSSPVDPPPADKSEFNLFHPTPENLMRDLDSDRPDKTNSPHTLDAGHLQFEMSFFEFAYDRHNPDHSPLTDRNWTWANANLRIGLTDWAEIQLGIPFYNHNRETDDLNHHTTHSEGIGDLVVAFKANAWGNDSGKTSGGFEIYVKTPTAAHDIGNGKVEGAALILLGTKLPGDFDLGFNTGVGVFANDDSGGYHAGLINSVSVSHSIFGPLSAYAELFTAVPTYQSHNWEATADFGLLLMIGKNVQLDGGLDVGLTRAADDLDAFCGITVRW